jgi:hypothetical protein
VIQNLGSQAKKQKISVGYSLLKSMLIPVQSHPVDTTLSSVVASDCETTFSFNSPPSKSKLPVESVLSVLGQIFVQLKNNSATMDLECSYTATMDLECSHTTAMDSECSHAIAMDSAHNHMATMDLEHCTHLQLNANLSEESSLAL